VPAEVRPLPATHLPPPPGTTALVSTRVGGGFAGGPSAQASISANGRLVAFSSLAPDLVEGDTNGAQDVFIRDMRNGNVFRASLPGGAPVPPGGRASDPSISAGGGVVAFTYQPPSGLTGAVGGPVILAWDLLSGATTIASRTATNAAAQGSTEAAVSADGRYVAFTSTSPAIVGGDGNGQADVFRYDRVGGGTVLVSAGTGGGSGDSGSFAPAISADGNIVAFQSDASNLAAGVSPELVQIFVRDVAAGTTTLATPSIGGGNTDGASALPAISADGRFVAFESAASDLVAGDANGVSDAFVRDRVAGTTTLVSVGLNGSPASGPSGQAAISADGRIVAFASTATDVVAAAPADEPAFILAAVVLPRSEVYARDVVASETIRISEAAAGGAAGAQNAGPTIGGNGRFVAFATTSPAVIAGDGNAFADVVRRDLPPIPTLTPPVLDFGTRAIGIPAPPAAASLSNAGWGPLTVVGATIAGAAAADFGIPLDGCTSRSLHRDEACTLTISFTATAEGPRTASLQVTDDLGPEPRTVRLVGVGSEARLVLDPPVGPPGIVTIAEGSGFPPGAEVALAWGTGISPKIAPNVVGPDGTFRVQVLVFHKDTIGRRDLVATPAGGAGFPPVAVPFVVTPAAAQPPSFVILYLTNPAMSSLVIRR
jgi:Tol biopolymer transport system component